MLAAAGARRRGGGLSWSELVASRDGKRDMGEKMKERKGEREGDGCEGGRNTKRNPNGLIIFYIKAYLANK